MENVKNLISKRFTLYLNELLNYLSSLGYKNRYRILNAKNYNISQNRERVLMISIMDKNATFDFPTKIEPIDKSKDLP